MRSSTWIKGRRFAYLLPGLHGILLLAICIRDIEDIVPRIGIIDFPLTLMASPVLMNVDVWVAWIVLYYLVFGSLLWYFAGKMVDRFLEI